MECREPFECGGAPKSKVVTLGCCGGSWSWQEREDMVEGGAWGPIVAMGPDNGLQLTEVS